MSKTAHKCHINRNIKVFVSIRMGSIKMTPFFLGCSQFACPQTKSFLFFLLLYCIRRIHHGQQRWPSYGVENAFEARKKNRIKSFMTFLWRVLRGGLKLEKFLPFFSFHFFFSGTISFVSGMRPLRPDFGTFFYSVSVFVFVCVEPSSNRMSDRKQMLQIWVASTSSLPSHK